MLVTTSALVRGIAVKEAVNVSTSRLLRNSSLGRCTAPTTVFETVASPTISTVEAITTTQTGGRYGGQDAPGGQVTEVGPFEGVPPCSALDHAVSGRRETDGAAVSLDRSILPVIGRGGHVMPVTGRPNLATYYAMETPRPLFVTRGRAVAIT